MDENEKEQDVRKKSVGTPVLDNFSRDLNKLAAEGKLDPVVGREVEITRIAQILSRRKKNNAIIIGEPGAGKTSIVEGLAIQIHEGKCPRNLRDKRIVNLDLTSIVAGTKYRGQFEERMKAIIEEIADNPDVIIFIDEIHTMVGAGNRRELWMLQIFSNQHYLVVKFIVLVRQLLMNIGNILKKMVLLKEDFKKLL